MLRVTAHKPHHIPQVVAVHGDEIIVDQPVNSDELAWVLYNEMVFVSEYHLEEESLENYFIHRIGGAHYA